PTGSSQRALPPRAASGGGTEILATPLPKADLVPAIAAAVSRYAEVAALEGEVSDLTERLETRKVVERAKGLLQDKRGMSEPDAFRWLQKTSMDKRLSMRAVAEGVVPGTGTPDRPRRDAA